MNPPPSNKSGTIDGWNDPPANLSLPETMSTKRVLLNKRVPYTNQDLTPVAPASNVLTAPPVSAPPQTASTTTSNASSSDIAVTLDDIRAIFDKQIVKLEDSSSVEKKILEDIHKKFQVMCDEWSQDKLALNTKQTLAKIFEELDENHVQQAFDLHVNLVRNAGGEVVRFIVGIKRMIQELQRLAS